MEDNIYRDDFEQMLRDTTEEFRMYPSRKVWHSIYNDLHPDRKWPSFAVSLLLLTAILYIGVTNNNQISKRAVVLLASKPVASLQVAAYSTPDGVENQEAEGISPDVTIGDNVSPSRNERNSLSQTLVNRNNETYNDDETQKFVQGANDLDPTRISATTIQGDEHVTNDLEENKLLINTAPVVSILNTERERSVNVDAVNKKDAPNQPDESKTVASTTNPLTELVHNQKEVKAQAGQQLVTPAEKAWIEDFAFHNMRNPDKWKNNLWFQYYITPSFGYRHLNKNNGFEPVNGALIRTTENDEVTQQAAPNLEAGAVMILGIGKRLKVKSGLQLNLTNYITYAHNLQHPIEALVPMNDLQSGNQLHQTYSTTYGNVLGSNYTKLNNRTVQLSLPIGIDYKVAGTEKIKWHMGVGIQPSYVLGGNAYLISSDNKNFVQDDRMLRRWNASANLETFVSVKAPSGVDINVGPQLRYQLFSTYSNKYSYTEKLYNLGIKIGVTKKL